MGEEKGPNLPRLSQTAAELASLGLLKNPGLKKINRKAGTVSGIALKEETSDPPCLSRS